MIFFSYLTDFSYFPLKVAGHDLNMSKMEVLKGSVSYVVSAILIDFQLFHFLKPESSVQNSEMLPKSEILKFTICFSRTDLLSFSLAYCPADMIEPILQAKAVLETQVIY